MRRLSLWAQWVGVLAHGALLLLLVLRGSVLAYCAAAILLIPLPGLLRGRRYTYQWASMLLAIYCALWLAEMWSNLPGRAAALLLASLSAVEFVSLVLFVRLQDRERHGQTAG
ncbi:DUF2069 domain-containing protein [Sinimarinibacterium sp. NLF-5-8]|uniref:DUF2069 domain-containing protein n=1 Tax=Sinimarinibacterium sp. NLF-5-8 TaxID=2698684 RepID=UPI00137BF5D9|nr:DUF2069 domain-containing protein [Sinimarinibacterium sp. NLF-5-8]QHS09162.1 DUF2069 domain-containing protein [Sinimarinibacterium sp. NLF-5-8]